MKKWINRIGYTVLVLVVLLNVMAFFHAWQFTHFYPNAEVIDLKNLSLGQKVKMVFFGYQFPKSRVTRYPDVPFDSVSYAVAGDLNISGWLIKSDSSTNKAAILFHGHAGQKGSLLDQAAYLRKQGYSTLLVDFRAHGQSDGTTCTIGFDEAEEVIQAHAWLQAKGYEHIVLYGTSMGAAAIMKALHDKPLPVQGLILEMPFGSLPDAVKGRMRIMGLPDAPLGELLTFWGGTQRGYWAFDYSPCDYALQLNVPVLLQWGNKDARVQEHETQCIYQNLPAQKQLVVYEGAGHQSLYAFNAPQWESSIQSFLRSVE
jgi:uncharacterized protein